MKKMRFCGICGTYTLKGEHCGKGTDSAHPPRYNPNDPHGRYRRMAKYGESHEGPDNRQDNDHREA